MPGVHVRAVLLDRFGHAPIPGEVPAPRPGRGQVLVRQAFSSINAGDGLMAAGRPYVFRPIYRAMLRPPVLGRDVAGVVEALGPGVSDIDVGDRVVGEAGQAWAERVVLPVGALARVPAGVGLREAAILPVAGVTALQGLRAGGLRAGQRVLVVGASGGVGHLAVQLAAATGATVTGVCSATKAARVRELGATHIIDHRTERFTEARGAWDLVLDLAGAEPLHACLATLREGGTFVSSSGIDGGAWLGPLPRMAWTALRGLVDRRIVVLTTKPDPDDLAELLGWLADGRLVPWIGDEVGLDEVPGALSRQRHGAVRGRTAVRIEG
jgi:NADPH:quinone reductase-like Zn-dependent oxidoreductase